MSQMPRSFFVQRPSFSSGGTWDCEPDSSLPSALRWPRSDASPSTTVAASDRWALPGAPLCPAQCLSPGWNGPRA